MIHGLLLAVMLSAMPETVHVFTQPGCPPCDRDRAVNGYGDSEVLIVYLHITDGRFPPEVTGTPAYYHQASGRWRVGSQTLAQVKVLAGLQPAAQTIPTVTPIQSPMQMKYRQVFKYRKRGVNYYAWEFVR